MSRPLHTENNSPGARERILEAALSVFARKGYSAASVREIVSAAGVTKPVLYYYFGSKEGLFQAILEEAQERHKAAIDLILETDGPAIGRFTRFFQVLQAHVKENEALVRMFHGMAFGPAQGAPLEPDLNGFFLRQKEAVKAIYLTAASRGEMIEADPDAVANLIVAILDHTIHFSMSFPESYTPERLLEMLRLVFQGLATRKD